MYFHSHYNAFGPIIQKILPLMIPPSLERNQTPFFFLILLYPSQLHKKCMKRYESLLKYNITHFHSTLRKDITPLVQKLEGVSLSFPRCHCQLLLSHFDMSPLITTSSSTPVLGYGRKFTRAFYICKTFHLRPFCAFYTFFFEGCCHFPILPMTIQLMYT